MKFYKLPSMRTTQFLTLQIKRRDSDTIEQRGEIFMRKRFAKTDKIFPKRRGREVR